MLIRFMGPGIRYKGFIMLSVYILIVSSGCNAKGKVLPNLGLGPPSRAQGKCPEWGGVVYFRPTVY